MTSEIAIMNQRALVFAADSATTVSYVLANGKRTTRYFKGANKLFQLSTAHPVGLMIYGSASLHGIPWEIVIREFRRGLGTDSCATVAAYATRFFEFVRTNDALFPEGLRVSALTDAAVGAAVQAWTQATNEVSALARRKRRTALGKIVDGMLVGWRARNVAPPLVALDIAAGVADYLDDVSQQLMETAASLMEGADAILIPQLAEIGLQAAMKRCKEFLNSTGIVIGGYGETEFFPSFEEFECLGFLGPHFVVNRGRAETVSRENIACIESFAVATMIHTFRMGFDPETFESVSRATSKALRELAGRVRDTLSPDANVPNLDGLIAAIAAAHKRDWYSDSIRAHYLPLIRSIGSLPVTDLAALAKTLVELESLKERVTRESESIAGPIDVAAISKHDGFIWMSRKHYFKSELNPRFLIRQRKGHGD